MKTSASKVLIEQMQGLSQLHQRLEPLHRLKTMSLNESGWRVDSRNRVYGRHKRICSRSLRTVTIVEAMCQYLFTRSEEKLNHHHKAVNRTVKVTAALSRHKVMTSLNMFWLQGYLMGSLQKLKLIMTLTHSSLKVDHSIQVSKIKKLSIDQRTSQNTSS